MLLEREKEKKQQIMLYAAVIKYVSMAYAANSVA
jgi:hypothetical protein